MDSDVNALDDLLSSLEAMNSEELADVPPVPSAISPPRVRETGLGEKKGLGVKVVAGEPNTFGVRLRKVNAAELAPSAAGHASIAGEKPLATQVPTYAANAPAFAAAPAPPKAAPARKNASPQRAPAATLHAKPPPPPTLRAADDDVDHYLNSLSQAFSHQSKKFVDPSDGLVSDFDSTDLAVGLPPPPRPFTIPPIPATELQRQIAELDEVPPQPLGRTHTMAAAAAPSTFPPGVETAPVSRLPPRPSWSALHTDLTYTPHTGSVGVYGITYKGTWQPVGAEARHVAVKRMKHHDLSAQYLQYFEDEVPRLVALNHPNLLPLLGVCLQDFIFTLFEWHDGTTLATYLEKSPRVSAETAVRIAREIANGVQELHECGVAHGSLRPTNVMLDRQQQVRLVDYGFEYVKMEVRRSGQTMGCEYNAPEQLENGPKHGTADAVDVYSISIIINQLFAGVPPFAGLLPRVIVAGVAQSALRPQLAASLPAALRRTVQSGWAQQPERRPTFATIAGILSSPTQKLLA